MSTPKRQRAQLDVLGLVLGLAIILVAVGTIVGGLACAFGDTYTVGEWVHDIALLVLGLGAVAIAARPVPLWQSYSHTSVASPSEAWPPRPPDPAAPHTE